MICNDIQHLYQVVKARGILMSRLTSCVGDTGVRFVTNFANYMISYILHHVVGKVRHKTNACGR